MNSMADQYLEVIDEQRALDLLDKALAERGEDYIYEPVGGMCVYFADDGQPSCLVGHALALHGVTAKEVGVQNRVHVGMLELPILTDRAAVVWGAAQQAQDSGTKWGEAVAAAHIKAKATS